MGKNRAKDAALRTTTTEPVMGSDIMLRLARTIATRRGADPATSYVATLFAKGDEAMVKKIGEEATEAVMAAMDGDKLRLTAEVADLWFHCLVVLVKNGLGPEDVFAELARREGISGLQEKAGRL
jgi:phosphoribosyl-ATP pyrophosphohydrolase